jgi:hypothetical protein
MRCPSLSVIAASTQNPQWAPRRGHQEAMYERAFYGRFVPQRAIKKSRKRKKPKAKLYWFCKSQSVGKGEFTKLSVMLHRNAHYSQKEKQRRDKDINKELVGGVEP